MQRTVKFFEDGDDVVIIERTRESDSPWQEDRVVLTRKEIAKLAEKFPVPFEKR